MVYDIKCVIDRTINLNLEIISNKVRMLPAFAIVSMKEVVQNQYSRMAGVMSVVALTPKSQNEPPTDVSFQGLNVELNDYECTVFSSSSSSSTVSAGLAIQAVVDARRA